MHMSMDKIGMLLGEIAPLHYAEQWDNCGFNVNLHQNEVLGVLVCLDVTPEVINEAVEKKCNLILSHHPLLFDGIKKLDTSEYGGRCMQMLIEHSISLYCAHTNVDVMQGGINTWLADAFLLENRRSLAAYKTKYYKVAVTVPKGEEQAIKQAFARARAGELGEYTHCTYSVEGEGTFMPKETARPHIGTRGELARVQETWIQALCSEENLDCVLSELKKAHPYEQPAIDVFSLHNVRLGSTGLGVLGTLPEKKKTSELLCSLKEILSTDSVRLRGDLEEEVSCIAFCGGSGGDLIEAAQKGGAQLYVTGEVRHHQYLCEGIQIVEAGHYDTEKCFCQLMAAGLQKKLNELQYNSKVPITITQRQKRPYINY